MVRINTAVGRLARPGEEYGTLEPNELFKLVAGTSTGGLISIMLGKLGMTVEECIKKYHELSKKIFKKKRFRGGLTHGLSQSKYSGKTLRQCVSDLIDEKGFDREIKMKCDEIHDPMAWLVYSECLQPRNVLTISTSTVVCRELAGPSKYSQLKRKPVFLCNRPCNIHFPHSVCDAALATASPPTFLPVVKLGDRCFVDGGMEYNNPSYAIQDHYGQENRVQSSRISIPSVTPQPTPSPTSQHGDLDISRVRYINIGTGTKTDIIPERKRDLLASLVPSVIRTTVFLKETLTQIAVDSEKTADHMRILEKVSHGDIIYDRFSAGNGVCYFKLDRWADLDKIEALTVEYLAEEDTKASLQQVANKVASEYVETRRAEAAISSNAAKLFARPIKSVYRRSGIEPIIVGPEGPSSTGPQKPEQSTPALPTEESGNSTVTGATLQTIFTGTGSRQSTPPSDLEETTPFPHTDRETDRAASSAQETLSKPESTRASGHSNHDSDTAARLQAAAPDTATPITSS